MALFSVSLTKDQKNAIKVFKRWLTKPDEKFMIIDGAAGCGKTTLIEHLYIALQSQMKMYELLLCKNPKKGKFKVQLTATTNKAVAVLQEITGIEAQTIHNLLGLKVTSNYQTGEMLLTRKDTYDLLHNYLIIIDEGSMLDDRLFKILDETACDCKIVIIGDGSQLAPVKQKVSIMEKLKCTKVTLHKIMRHTGPILHTGALFRETVKTGVFTDIPTSTDVEHVDGNMFQKLIDKAFTDKKYQIDTAKVLAWTNNRVNLYNQHIRTAKGYPTLYQRGETVFTNNPIMAGKIMIPTDGQVTVVSVGPLTTEKDVEGHYIQLEEGVRGFLPLRAWDVKHRLKIAAHLAKQTKNWTEYFAIKQDWLDLRPAYASTVHKAQGSSYKTVFIDLTDIGKCRISSDVARLLYVAISRATDKVILYGSLPAKYRGAIAA